MGCRTTLRAALLGLLDLIATHGAVVGPPRIESIEVTAPGEALEARAWSAGETHASGVPVVWMRERRTAMHFAVGSRPSAGTVTLRFVREEAGRDAGLVHVRMNGRPLGRIDVGPVVTTSTFPFTVQMLEGGRNRIDVLLVRGGTGDSRRADGARVGLVGVEFTWNEPADDSVRHDGGRLVLKPGARLDRHVRVESGTRLHLTSSGPVEVMLASDEAPSRSLGRFAGDHEGSLDLAPGRTAPHALRITLHALGPQPAVVTRAVVEHGPHATLPPPTRPPRPLNVVLYIADTLRADALGCYGNARATSKHLDALARESVLFERTLAQGPWTRPTVASIVTGRWPGAHGAIGLMDRMRDDVPVMAELFRAAGYATAAFVANPIAGAPFGFARGFDTFDLLDEDRRRPALYASATDLDARAIPWLEAQRDRPFLLQVHAIDPHAPYAPDAAVAGHLFPEGLDVYALRAAVERALDDPDRVTPETLATMRAAYDGDVATLDAGFGVLRAALTRLGLDDSTIVVFIGDHGEEFRDHGGFEHGHTLYEEIVRVPFLVRLPGGKGGGRRVAGLARQVDVLPTVLALAGLPVPASLDGAVLLDGDGVSRVDTDEGLAHGAMRGAARRELLAWVVGPHKVVTDRTRGTVRIFDLGADPREGADRAGSLPVLAAYGREAAIVVHDTAAKVQAPPVVDPALERRLRALGYLPAEE